MRKLFPKSPVIITFMVTIFHLYNMIMLLIKSSQSFLVSDSSKLLQSFQCKYSFPMKLQLPSQFRRFLHADKAVSRAKVDFSDPSFNEVCIKSSALTAIFCGRKQALSFSHLPGLFLQAKALPLGCPVQCVCVVGSVLCG